jgi:hypothetical protein
MHTVWATLSTKRESLIFSAFEALAPARRFVPGEWP